jgi:small subunit ribosomal protein S4
LARYTEPACRICRREGGKLFLKGDRCYGAKCSFERRQTGPGMHGVRRGKPTSYAIMLREKQKVKRSYGLLEKQFRALFNKAERQKGVTGGNLLILLERRLDNVCYKLGFSGSLTQARQVVSHGHLKVNGHKVDIPSYLVKPGDKIEVSEKSRKVKLFADSMETVARRGVPVWLELNKDQYLGMVKELPAREHLSPLINEQLIVELYSK